MKKVCAEEQAAPLERALALMNGAQRRAAQWREGPMLVLAGPGSGKTLVLTCRIAQILEESPDQAFRILALTFTNKAADEMRQRLARLAPGHENRLFLGTFHSFCSEVLRTHGTHVGVRPDFQIYSSRQDLESVVDSVLSDPKLCLEGGWRPTPDGILSTLDRLRGDLIPPEEVPRHFRDPRTGRDVEALYRNYEAKLRDLNAMDFGSMLLCTHHLFQRYPAVSRHYRRVYRFWCVDEFQDTNGAQYRLLKQMAGDSFRDLFVVADDDQIIYAWNGASHQRLVEFRNHFAPQVIQLSTNYRCPAPILDLANRLIAHNFERMQGKEALQAGKVCEPGLERIRLIPCAADEDEEAARVASDIRTRKIRPDATAILARNRTLLGHLKSALEAEGLRAELTQRRDDFVSPHFQWLHACLRQEVYRADARNLTTLAGSFSALSEVDIAVEEVQTRAGATHGDLLRAWVELLSEAKPGHPALDFLLPHLVEGRDYRRFIRSALDWLDGLVPEIQGFPDFDEDRRAWNELEADILGSIGVNAPLATFLQDLELRSKTPSPSPDAVRLLTIHSAKGLEWPHVYLVGMAEGILPSYQALKAGAQSLELEEERRNCFVAITRAKETLTMSRAETYRKWRKAPSRFLTEMGVCG